ncbi:DNA polymerase IV [Kocuria sp. JC486]|uniref:DNA polymerase IV n=1 Tax=Kocuria sp. JC486 TaxID=1970736 RepID=UPI00141F7F10|nr:DNA polymerase IV [Kocuria sp. JC486]NHU84421.1 DNA polymerase IV [Kocuria sp. JC486]
MNERELASWRRTAIMHVDMDMFFVAVELLEHPELVGRPVIVAAQSNRSVVLSASYEARAFGVRSGMPLARARALCPQGTVLTPHYGVYPRYSRAVMDLFHEITDRVEQISVDEAFLDVSGAVRRLGPPVHIARELRRRIRAATSLTASVGIGSTKTVAKIASTRSKPDGLLLVDHDDSVAFLAQLPVSALWGVGQKTAQILQTAGYNHVGDLAAQSPATLARLLGPAAGAHLHALANGHDPRPVTPVREEKSLGAEGTFEEDVTDLVTLRRELLGLSHRTAARLRSHRLRARRIGLKLRWSDFSTISRSRTVEHPFASGHDLFHHANELLAQELPLAAPVRLIGVRAESLEDDDTAVQLSLDGREEHWAAVESAMDQARARFGDVGLGPASMLGHKGTGHRRQDSEPT